MDEFFDRLNRPFGSLAELADALLQELVRRADLTRAEMPVPGHGVLTVLKSGRSQLSQWSQAPRPPRPRGGADPPTGSVDDAVHAAEWFEVPAPSPPARPVERDDAPGTLTLPLTYGGQRLGDLVLVWRSEGDRRRAAPPWLTPFARQCGFLINRYQVQDWAARRLGRPLILVGLSRPIRRLEAMLEQAGQSDLPVLLAGEFGTEKLALAATIHCGGARREGPFVQVNCGDPGGEPAEWFAQAAGGTLLLNGVDEMPARLQRQLPLHMRSHLGQWSSGEGVSDARIIASTQTDLRDQVADGSFSRSLLAELDILSVAAPPLRDRRGDIDAHIAAALHRQGFSPEDKLSEAMTAACRSHPWPENLFELDRVVTRLAVMTGPRPIQREDIVLHAPWILSAEDGFGEADAPFIHASHPAAESERWIRCAVHKDAAELGRLHEGLARALLYLGDHYAEPISLGQLARHAHVSESHLSFLFRTALDLPFKGVLGRIRVHKAKEILASESRRHITEVALSVGFADLSHFEKSFKRIVGQSPREFRRRAAMGRGEA